MTRAIFVLGKRAEVHDVPKELLRSPEIGMWTLGRGGVWDDRAPWAPFGVTVYIAQGAVRL